MWLDYVAAAIEYIQLNSASRTACQSNWCTYVQRGVASAAFAAVIYIEERRAQVACLWYLLQSQASPDDDVPEEVQQVLFQYTTALLRQEQGGKRTIVNHLLQLVKASFELHTHFS